VDAKSETSHPYLPFPSQRADTAVPSLPDEAYSASTSLSSAQQSSQEILRARLVLTVLLCASIVAWVHLRGRYMPLGEDAIPVSRLLDLSDPPLTDTNSPV